jgi:PKD repeat protein
MLLFVLTGFMIQNFYDWLCLILMEDYMRKIFGLLLLSVFMTLQSVSIYDVQFTADSSGDSPYDGEIVTVSGIVTATNMKGEADNIFISHPDGGAWNGIYIYNCGVENLNVGDEVEVTGLVDELYGQTIIMPDDDQITVNLLSTNNQVPEPVEITTLALSTEEMYEGVLVKISNVEVTEAESNFNEWLVTDGSGNCQIDDNMFHLSEIGETIEVGDTWNYICGVVDYSYSTFGLNPRFVNDFYNPGMLFARFRTGSTTTGLSPLTVDFIDLSHGEITSWEWDFDNDGNIDSNEQNPTFTFNESGSYDVKLTVSDGTNTSSIIMPDVVLVYSETDDLGFKVMTYNVLYFGGDDDDVERVEHLKAVIEHEDPDVVMFQEVENRDGAEILLNSMNEISNSYRGAEFIDGPGGPDCWFIYKGRIGTFVEQNIIDTRGRNIMEYILDINGYELRFYVCHLKAGTSTDDKEQRGEEATSLREHLNQLPSGTEFIIAGDMNLYTHSEDAYEAMVDELDNSAGRAKDCSDAVGHWHNNSEFRWVHSQCPRTTPFGGSSGGGLDDRFDFILTSFDMNNGDGIEYLENSYRVVGQDGDHYNQAVNSGNNSAVPSDIADDLYYGSDHLPVVAEFSANPYDNDDNIIPNSETTISTYPNPFISSESRSGININFNIARDAKVEVTIYNTKGQKIDSVPVGNLRAGSHNIKWDGKNSSNNDVASGVYLFRITENSKTTGVTKSLILK